MLLAKKKKPISLPKLLLNFNSAYALYRLKYDCGCFQISCTKHKMWERLAKPKCHQDPQHQLTDDTAQDCRPHLPKHLKNYGCCSHSKTYKRTDSYVFYNSRPFIPLGPSPTQALMRKLTFYSFNNFSCFYQEIECSFDFLLHGFIYAFYKYS